MINLITDFLGNGYTSASFPIQVASVLILFSLILMIVNTLFSCFDIFFRR